jgi:predicted AAA+ superfamily ATPase
MYNIIMIYIQRSEEKLITSALNAGLIAILYGPRQVGKTTLAKKMAEKFDTSVYLSCDDPLIVTNLQNKSAQELKAYIGNAELVIIDEAQRVENIGITLKLIHDTYPEIKLLVTGSSSLDLANKINEPLTGRSQEILLYPFSIQEISKNPSDVAANARIMMDRGGYPGIWQLSADSAHAKLSAIANNYVFRDAFSPQVIYDQTIILNLLRLLAHQIGSEVSYGELASKLEISKETVKRYIDLLEKAFIVFRLNQYRRNQRVEVGRLRKVYFVDLGIRNAIIDNFSPLDMRQDIGALWENFCVVERIKYLQSVDRRVRFYYWRNLDQREIDLIEEEANMLRVFEIKYNSAKLPKLPVAFTKQYPHYDSYNLINFANILTTLLK